MDHLLHEVECVLRVEGARADTILQLHLHFAELELELVEVILLGD